MRKSTRRALRATATVAGVAALGASFVGTAAADTGSPLGGGNSYGGSDSHGVSGLGDSQGKSLVDEPGLATFELPGIGTGSRGMRTDGIPLLDALDGGDNESSEGPQHPVDNEGGNFAKNINFLGHDTNSSYRGKSIGSRSMRTDGGLLGDFGGSNNGESESDHGFDGDFYSHDNSRNESESYGHDDADGLSGHQIKLPFTT